MMDFEKRLTEIAGAANVKLEEPMKNHTTFRIGGPARYFVTPENADALILVIGLCRGEEKPFAVIGNGSNLLVSDQGYQGVVISTEKLDHCQVEGNQIRAGAGVKLARMAKQALEHGLAGLEFAAGIPGTVGGALVMNAGAYGSGCGSVNKRRGCDPADWRRTGTGIPDQQYPDRRTDSAGSRSPVTTRR